MPGPDADLAALAKVWRDRPPSGKFVLHQLPRNWWCPKCGAVTKWHQCGWHLPQERMPKIVRVW